MFLLQKRDARSMMTLGTSLLVAGVAVTLAAVAHGSIASFFLGTTITGAGFGASFQGAIRRVLPLLQPHQRAGLLSVLYVISYLAMGLPAIVAGARVVHGGGLLATTREYGVAVMALAAAALLGTLLRRRGPASARAR